MARNNPIYLQKRNEFIRNRFRSVRKKNPKWTIIAVIEEVAQDVFLSPSTVSRILKETDAKIPDAKTIRKYTTEYLTA